MSKSYLLCCDETKQKIWIGQSGNKSDRMTTLYSGVPEAMDALILFLGRTMGKPLVLRCDDDDETHGDYEEFYWEAVGE